MVIAVDFAPVPERWSDHALLDAWASGLLHGDHDALVIPLPSRSTVPIQ